MTIKGWVVLPVILLAPALATSQDAGKTLPSPLKEAYSAADKEYFSFACNDDGTLLAAGTSGGVRILYVTAADPVKVGDVKVLKHPGQVNELIFEPTTKTLISRSSSDDAQVWDTSTWTPIKYALEDRSATDLLPRLARPKAGIPDCASLFLANKTRGLRLWILDGLNQKRRSVAQVDIRDWDGISLGHVTAHAALPNALLVGDDQGYLCRLPDVRKILKEATPDAELVLGRMMKSTAAAKVFRPHLGEVTSIALSADENRCVTAGTDGKVRLWNMAKVPQLSIPRGGTPPTPEWEIAGRLCDLTQDGKLIAVADDQGVGVYQSSSGVALSWNPISPKGRLVRLRFSPNNQFLMGIVCRCMECSPGDGITVVRPRRRQGDHGGVLMIWK